MAEDIFAAGSPATVPRAQQVETLTCDVAVIGSGMGGAATAYGLRDAGTRVLLVERGERLPREPANTDPEEVFGHGRYRNGEPWVDATSGRDFAPGVHYYVGGNTKVYGACLPRFRESDFGAVEHRDGISPPWPIGYADLEASYAHAERQLWVHGAAGEDPTEPWRSSPYPYPALPHEPAVADFAAALAAQGLHPFAMPMGVDRRPGGRCVRCRTCDGFPCYFDAKGDAQTAFVEPALDSPDVRLLTGARVMTLEMSADGRQVLAARALRGGVELRIRAARFVLAAGAVNTAALLLRSAAEGSSGRRLDAAGLVGRRYMAHNLTFVVGLDPRRRNRTRFQKTLGLNDFYERGARSRWPLGNLQMLGKLQAPMVAAARRGVPRAILAAATAHSIDVLLTTEDLPRPENRVSLTPGGRIALAWSPTNLGPHRELLARTRTSLRRAGYPLVLSERVGIATPSHMCGTAVMGTDSAHSVLDPQCRLHDVANLWVTDASCFPSSAAVNPALTIAANALRVSATPELRG